MGTSPARSQSRPLRSPAGTLQDPGGQGHTDTNQSYREPADDQEPNAGVPLQRLLRIIIASLICVFSLANAQRSAIKTLSGVSSIGKSGKAATADLRHTLESP